MHDDMGGMSGFDWLSARCEAAEQEVKRLAAENAELRKDAERYRWLRDEAHDWEDARIVNLYSGPDIERASGEELDAIIDIEMGPKDYLLILK